MLKLAKILLILILIFILTAAFFRHMLLGFLICNAVIKTTGLKLSIEELSLNILDSSLYMGGITLFNPPGFKNKTLGKAKEIFIKYDLLDSLNGRLNLRQVKADISEINIIRNKEGISNVSAFKKEKSQVKSSRQASPLQNEARRNKRKRLKFLIDHLELSLEKATFIDYKAGIGEPAVIIYTGKDPFVFKNVSALGNVINSVSLKEGFRKPR